MTTSKLITKRDLRKVFFRSFPMEWTWNYEKQQNLGYTYAMIPIIEKLYKDKPEEKQQHYRDTWNFLIQLHIW